MLGGVACRSEAEPVDSAPAQAPAVAKGSQLQPSVDAEPPTSTYRTPSEELVRLVDAPRTPQVRVGPKGQRLMLAERESYPAIAFIAEPFLSLAGRRINPRHRAMRNTYFRTGLTFLDLADGSQLRAELPSGARLTHMSWAPDGRHVAFAVASEDGLRPWIVDVTTGRARKLNDRRLNDILGRPLRWMPGSGALLARFVVEDEVAPPVAPRQPLGPSVQETSAGTKAQNRTYQDLLQSPHDERLFAYYARSQLALVDLEGDNTVDLGGPGLLGAVRPSPDGQYLMVETVHEPFSYQVPAGDFPHRVEVWNRRGEVVKEIVDLPLADAVPIGGVAQGPRSFGWQPHKPATLQWVEALDEGNPKVEAEHRDRILRLAAPFSSQPREVIRVEHRYAGVDFTTRPDEMLVHEYDRDRRWETTRWYPAQGEPRVIFDRSVRDRYADPGSPHFVSLEDATRVVLVHEGAILLTGSGASDQGDRPFLDRFVLASGSKERLFQSGTEAYVSVVGLSGAPGAEKLILRRESPADPPNYFLRDGENERPLTRFPNPYPQLKGIEKRLLTYKRADGVPLSGTLYLPPGYDGKEKLPLLVWAYPVEYNDKRTAGQVRAQPNRFTRISGHSPLTMLTQGYAVLDGAAMPVVGDPETMNDTLIPQLVAAAQAAVDAVVKEGVADRDRVAVGGHSYGAFMTANLLAHSDIFRAGLARSGAYNRSLTPFGFQSERRTLWEAPEAYLAVSPLFSADKIDEPILLVHGEADNNSGTYPLQSRRLFHALKGLGGQARLVMLPHESHGYRARESVLHVVAETVDWLDQHVKNAPDRDARPEVAAR